MTLRLLDGNLNRIKVSARLVAGLAERLEEGSVVVDSENFGDLVVLTRELSDLRDLIDVHLKWFLTNRNELGRFAEEE